MARLITIEDLYQVQFVSKPAISPDGRSVAYVVTRIDGQKHEYRSAIWVAPTGAAGTGEPRRFTSESAHTGSPVWSPDGRWLAFVTDRAGEEAPAKDSKEQKKHGKGKPQIWLIPVDGGEARQLTRMEHGASSPTWSPDSQHILFNAAVGPADEENDEGKPFPKARVLDNLWYRLDGVGYIYERRSHLFLINAAGGEPQQLTDGDWDEGEAAWSPDGQQIAFTSDRSQDRWRLPGADVYVLALLDGKTGDARRLTDQKLSCFAPSWSPDGKTIAFLAATKLNSAGENSLYTISADASDSAATELTREFEGNCMDWTNSDIGDEHLAPAPAWSADGATLYILASQRGATRLYAIPANGSGASPATLTPGNVHVRDFSVDTAKNTLALLLADATHPQEIYIRSTAPSAEMQQLTTVNRALLAELTLAEPEYMSYTGAEGWQMDGWILKPHDFDPAKKYPLVVEIHGGPNTQYGYGFFHEMQMLVAQGYVVLYTNPRGSCGYGYDFANAVRGAWGEKDSLDIMEGVDALLQRGYIDEQRMGVTGGSYGGFMTNWLIGHNNRFKVAVTDRCVSNMASMFGVSDFGWTFADDLLDTTPWENLDKYMHMSPIKYVQNMQTPLLIIHSEQDLRCGIEQAEQLFTALKYMGREVQFVRFEGQSHGLSRGGHPKLRLERLRHIQSWFARYLA
jgi:dipeptidyl aminopeptidase/acylaminoacyl peptidase